MTDESIEQLVEEIQSGVEQLAKRSQRSLPVLHPPPSRDTLASRIKQLPVPPPPSYLGFLTRHNGWDNFWIGYSLLGVDGPHTERALEDIRVTVDEDTWAQKKYFPDQVATKFAERERKKPNFVHLPNHIIFATNFNGGLGVFDSRTRGDDLEMGVILWTPAGITDRHANFEAMLKAALRETQAALQGS